jgi:hypothetical protein
MNQEAYVKMLEAELAYLLENGWVLNDNGSGNRSWSNEELERSDLTQGHAVNVQKQFDRIRQ